MEEDVSALRKDSMSVNRVLHAYHNKQVESKRSVRVAEILKEKGRLETMQSGRLRAIAASAIHFRASDVCARDDSTQWLVGAMGPKPRGCSWTLPIVSTLEPRHQQQPDCNETRSHSDGDTEKRTSLATNWLV